MRRLLLLLVLLMTTGCASALGNAIRASNAAGSVADHAHGVLLADTKRGYDACLGLDTKGEALVCIESNRASFAPSWQAYRTLRATWLDLTTLIQAALAGDGVLPAAAAILMGKLTQATGEMNGALK